MIVMNKKGGWFWKSKEKKTKEDIRGWFVKELSALKSVQSDFNNFLANADLRSLESFYDGLKMLDEHSNALDFCLVEYGFKLTNDAKTYKRDLAVLIVNLGKIIKKGEITKEQKSEITSMWKGIYSYCIARRGYIKQVLELSGKAE